MDAEPLPREMLVSPVVSLDDIEHAAAGMVLEPALTHVIHGPGQKKFYQGDSPGAWLAENGYVKRLAKAMCRSSQIDGWYELSPD